MVEIKSLLLVSGTQKNCGKTTLACEIIKKFAPIAAIIGIKITLHPLSPEATNAAETPFSITEEAIAGNQTDTQRMLQAGAKKSFLISCNGNNFLEAFLQVYNEHCIDKLTVCETNTLRMHVKPGILALATSNCQKEIKPSAQYLLPFADFTITYQDMISTTNCLSEITIENGTWKYMKCP